MFLKVKDSHPTEEYMWDAHLHWVLRWIYHQVYSMVYPPAESCVATVVPDLRLPSQPENARTACCQYMYTYTRFPSCWKADLAWVAGWYTPTSIQGRCWLGGRKGIQPVKTEQWGAGMAICLERGADLHMAQLMPLPFTVSCFSKIQIGSGTSSPG